MLEFVSRFRTRTVFAGAKQNNTAQERLTTSACWVGKNAPSVYKLPVWKKTILLQGRLPPSVVQRAPLARVVLHGGSKHMMLGGTRKKVSLKTLRSSCCSRVLVRSSYQRGKYVYDNSGIVAWSCGVVEKPALYCVGRLIKGSGFIVFVKRGGVSSFFD